MDSVKLLKATELLGAPTDEHSVDLLRSNAQVCPFPSVHQPNALREDN